MVSIASQIKPADCCLVPERREELTTEGGLDVARNIEHLGPVVARLARAGIRVSLFIDPDPDQVDAVMAVNAPVIELHTGAFAEASGAEQKKELARVCDAARVAQQKGLIVNAGHGLHYENVKEIAEIPEIVELNIGHAIVSRAVFDGFPAAVSEMKRLMMEARGS
jgi:pyridoxine 5-phosphate synthase